MSVARPPDVGGLLNAFVAELGRETKLLQQIVSLRTRKTDTGSRARMTPLLGDIDAALKRLDANVQVLREYHYARAAVVSADSIRAERHAQASRARIAAIRSQLPKELLSSLLQKETLPAADDAPVPANRPPLALVSNHRRGNASVPAQHDSALLRALAAGCDGESGGGRTGTPRENKPAHTTAGGVSQRAKKSDDEGRCASRSNSSDSAMATIRSITQADLDCAPSYVRGRLTVERSRSVVTALNKVISSKYEFLSRNAKTLSSDDVTLRQDMQAVEEDCSEISGRLFFTDADCKHYDVRFDAITKSVVNMLRHISVLKEVRGKNKIRVFIVVT